MMNHRLKGSTDKLESYYLATMTGSREATVRLQKNMKDWTDMMHNEASYEQRISKNDVAILLSSGFNPVKPTILEARAEFSVENGEKPGSVFLWKKASKKGKVYW
jgi:hypothetical protein